MPKIDTYTARGETAIVRLPGTLPAEPSGLETLGAGLMQAGLGGIRVGAAFSDLEKRIEKQQDVFDFHARKGRYDAALEDYAKNVLPFDEEVVQNPSLAAQRFRDKEWELQAEITEGIRPGAYPLFKDHRNLTLDHRTVQVRSTARAMQVVSQVAALDADADSTIRAAAQAPSVEDAQRAILGHARLADFARSTGIITPVDYGKRLRDVSEKALEARAELAVQNPPAFREAVDRGDFAAMVPGRLLHWQTQALEVEDKAQARYDRERERVKTINKTTYTNQAALGILSEDSLRAGLDEGFITDEEANKYRAINMSPPDAAADLSVDLIMDRFAARDLTTASVERARRELEQNQLEFGLRNDKRTTSLARLNSLKMAVEGSQAAMFRQHFESIMAEYDAAHAEELNESPLDKLSRRNERVGLRESLFDAFVSGRTDILEFGRERLKQLNPPPRTPTDADRLEDKIRNIYKNLPKR